jgi:centromeric protein E
LNNLLDPHSTDNSGFSSSFAQNAKKIKNKPKVNEVLSDQTTMKRMQREILDLKIQLEGEKSRNSAVSLLISIHQMRL